MSPRRAAGHLGRALLRWLAAVAVVALVRLADAAGVQDAYVLLALAFLTVGPALVWIIAPSPNKALTRRVTGVTSIPVPAPRPRVHAHVRARTRKAQTANEVTPVTTQVSGLDMIISGHRIYMRTEERGHGRLFEISDTTPKITAA